MTTEFRCPVRHHNISRTRRLRQPPGLFRFWRWVIYLCQIEALQLLVVVAYDTHPTEILHRNHCSQWCILQGYIDNKRVVSSLCRYPPGLEGHSS